MADLSANDIDVTCNLSSEYNHALGKLNFCDFCSYMGNYALRPAFTLGLYAARSDAERESWLPTRAWIDLRFMRNSGSRFYFPFVLFCPLVFLVVTN